MPAMPRGEFPHVEHFIDLAPGGKCRDPEGEVGGLPPFVGAIKATGKRESEGNLMWRNWQERLKNEKKTCAWVHVC